MRPSPSEHIRAHPGAFQRIQAHPTFSSGQHLACAAKRRASRANPLASRYSQPGKVKGKSSICRARPLASRRSQRTRSAAKGLAMWRRVHVGTRRCEGLYMRGLVHARACTCERPHLRACIPNSQCYTYSSCSRIILNGCSPVTILKMAPNSPF